MSCALLEVFTIFQITASPLIKREFLLGHNIHIKQVYKLAALYVTLKLNPVVNSVERKIHLTHIFQGSKVV